MKFAFLIMGEAFSACTDTAEIHNGTARMIGVANIEQACAQAKLLLDEGVDCIELCGAFEAAGAKRIIDATGNRIPVGYVTHLPEQDALFTALFG